MDVDQPWLAEVVESSLDAWFKNIDGTGSTEYQFHKVSDSLKVGTTGSRSVTLLKLPTERIAEPRGQVSDGTHVVEAVFLKDTASSLAQAGADTGALLRLTDPVVRITAHVNPPRPLLEIDQSVEIENKHSPQTKVPAPIPLVQEKSIVAIMARYHTRKEHNRSVLTTPLGSPVSIASQVPYSPQRPAGHPGGDRDEDESQQQFCTQAPISFHLDSPSKPAQSLIPPSSKPLTTSATTIGTATFPELQSPLCSPIKLSMSSKADGLDSLDKAPESSPLEVIQLGVEDQSTGAPVDTTTTEPIATHATHRSKSPAPLHQHVTSAGSLQRWRQQLRGGKYIPRYFTKIPRDQEEYLTSLLHIGDSWQPPLVGHVQRPGEVPFSLLKRFCDAADRQVEEPALPPYHVEPVAAITDSPTTQPDRGQGTREADTNAEDSRDAEIEWSQSPPTQQRRHKPLSVKSSPAHPPGSSESQDISPSPPVQPRQAAVLPQSSPPVVDVHHPRPPFDLQDSPEQRTTDAQYPSVTRQQLLVEDGGDDGVETPHIALSRRAHSNDSEMHIESTPSPSACSPHINLSGQQGRTTQKQYASSQMLRDTSAKKVQVKRTPFPGKGTNLLQRMRAGKAECQVPPSTFVPATYTSPNLVGSGGASMGLPARKATAAETANASQMEPLGSNRRSQTELHSPGEREQSQSSAHRKSPRPRLRSESAGGRRGPPSQLEEPKAAQTEEATGGEQATATTGQPQVRHLSFQPGGSSGDGVKVDAAAIATERSNPPASTRRRREDSTDGNNPSKRPRPLPPTTAVDPDLVPVFKDISSYRNQQMRLIGKPKIPMRQSTSSSFLDLDSSSGPLEAPLNVAKPNDLPRTATYVTRQSSTPITRQSTYSRAWHDQDKIGPGDSVSPHPPVPGSAVTDEILFAKYQAAYPDYEGTIDNFRRSYYFIQGVLNDDLNKIHSSLLDDAIYHDHHSYQPYRKRAGDSAMSFINYFNEHVDNPSHHKRIIKFAAHERPRHRDQSRTSTRSPRLVEQPQLSGARTQSVAETAAYPTPSAREEVQMAKSAFLANTASKERHRIELKAILKATPEAEPPATLSQESIEFIEQWRETAAARGSPELGSSDIDRSLLRSSPPKKPVSVVADVSSNIKRRSLPSIHAAPVPTRPATRDHTSTIAESKRHPRSSVPAPVKSAYPMTEPKIDIPSTAPMPSSSQLSEILPPRKLFRGTTTEFVKFDMRYAQLHQEKMQRGTSAPKTGSTARAGSGNGSGKEDGPFGTGIDIFLWR